MSYIVQSYVQTHLDNKYLQAVSDSEVIEGYLANQL